MGYLFAILLFLYKYTYWFCRMTIILHLQEKCEGIPKTRRHISVLIATSGKEKEHD